jgi:hypothetical protein
VSPQITLMQVQDLTGDKLFTTEVLANAEATDTRSITYDYMMDGAKILLLVYANMIFLDVQKS